MEQVTLGELTPKPVRGSFAAYRLGRDTQLARGWVETARGYDVTEINYLEWPRLFRSWDSARKRLEYARIRMEHARSRYGFINQLATTIRELLPPLQTYELVDSLALFRIGQNYDHLEKAWDDYVQRAAIFDQGMSMELRLDLIHPLYKIDLRARKELFVRKGGQLPKWWNLGSLVGDVIRSRNSDISDELAWLLVIPKIIELAGQLLPTDVLTDVKTVYEMAVESSSKFINICEPLSKLDAWINQNLIQPAAKYFLTFDDRLRILNYFGVDIPFSEFQTKASGGLRIMRVLAQSPGISIGAKQLVDAADLGIEEFEVTTYLSRLRDCIRKIFDNANAVLPINVDPKSETVKLCFIIPDRRARAQSGGKAPFYRLALPPAKVKYIAAE